MASVMTVTSLKVRDNAVGLADCGGPFFKKEIKLTIGYRSSCGTLGKSFILWQRCFWHVMPHLVVKVLSACQTGRRADPEHAGVIIVLSWLGNSSEYPRKSWWRWPEKGICDCFCLDCCHQDAGLDKRRWMDGLFKAVQRARRRKERLFLNKATSVSQNKNLELEESRICRR